MKFPRRRQLLRALQRTGHFLAWHLSWFFTGVGRFCRRTWLFLAGWRRGKFVYLLQGLPALAGFLAALAFAATVVLTPSDQQNQWYERLAEPAVRSRDWPTARLVLERLARQNPDRPDYRFELGLVYWGDGNPQRALTLIRSVAPDRGHGYAPAHIWLAKQMLHSPQPGPQLRETAIAHLLKALQSQPDAVEARAVLGQLYAQTKETLPDALTHLLAVQPQRPELALVLARVYQQMGERQRARTWAETARQVFRSRIDIARDDHDARFKLADALLLLDDYAAGVGALHQGLLLANTDPHRLAFRFALGRTYALWARSLPGTAEAKGRRLALIEEGLQVEPRSPELLLLLGETTRLDGPEADKSRALLQALLARGQATATLHMVLGADAYRRDKPDEARLHFDQANRLDPRMPEVANNLAWVLAGSGDKEELPRALELINAVVGQAPNNAHFRETRGQIYAKMGRWKEAVADLEAALPGMSDGKNVHRTLAEAYKQLGLAEIAAEHERLAGRRSP